MTKSWRDVLPVHPAAEFFPLMSPDERRELGEDIKKHGGLPEMPLLLWEAEKDAPLFLLDGRNRLDAMEAVGLPVLDKEGKWLAWALDTRCCTRIRGEDPYAYVMSANIHRRHLTAEQKRELIAKLLKAQPEKSDRQIGKMARTSKNTAAVVRREMERRGQIDHVEKRKDTKGRKQLAKRGPTSRAKPANKPKTAPADVQAIRDDAAKRICALMGRPEPPAREDIGPTSTTEIARKDAEIEELRNAKRQLEIKVAGLQSKIEELRAKLAATGTDGDMMSSSEFQAAHKRWEETFEAQRGIIARLENENANLRARGMEP